MSKIVKVGTVPGRIQEVAVEVNMTVKEVVELAGLTTSGYDVKVNGRTVTDSSKITSTTETILLVQKVKGNARILKVGTVPGRIQEVAVEDDTTVAQAIEMAGLNPSGYDVKVDGRVATLVSKLSSTASTVLLVQKVKGNK